MLLNYLNCYYCSASSISYIMIYINTFFFTIKIYIYIIKFYFNDDKQRGGIKIGL